MDGGVFDGGPDPFGAPRESSPARQRAPYSWHLGLNVNNLSLTHTVFVSSKLDYLFTARCPRTKSHNVKTRARQSFREKEPLQDGALPGEWTLNHDDQDNRALASCPIPRVFPPNRHIGERSRRLYLRIRYGTSVGGCRIFHRRKRTPRVSLQPSGIRPMIIGVSDECNCFRQDTAVNGLQDQAQLQSRLGPDLGGASSR